MPKCSFCGKMYDVPRGISFVLPNGTVLHFCSSKCFKNHKLGRVGKKTTWVVKEKKGQKKQEIVEEKQEVEEKKEKKEEKVEEKKGKEEKKEKQEKTEKDKKE